MRLHQIKTPTKFWGLGTQPVFTQTTDAWSKHHTFIMLKASIVKVTRNPKNREGCIVVLSNDEVLWLQTSYITSVLAANFIDDVRPTAIVGTSVSYDNKSYAVGDFVFDRKGLVKTGETVKFTTAGKRPINLIFDEVEGKITEFDKARMLSSAVANAMVRSAGAFAPVKRIAAEPADADTSAVLEHAIAGVDAGEPTI